MTRRWSRYFSGMARRDPNPDRAHRYRELARLQVEREHGAGHEPGTRPDACGRCWEDVRKNAEKEEP